MPNDQSSHKPSASADAEALSASQIDAKQAASPGYRVRLTRVDNGSVSYLGQSGGNWAELTEQKDAVKVEIHIKIVGSNRWLSPSSQDTVGWFLGNGSTGWVREASGVLKSQYNGLHLSIRDNGYLYAYDDYPQLKVDLEPI